MNGVTAESPQVALVTKGDSVGSEINHPSPPQPTVAPQLNGSVNEQIEKCELKIGVKINDRISCDAINFLLAAAEMNELV